MTYILPYAIQKGNLIYLLKSGSDVQSVKPSMPQHVRSHLKVHRINQLPGVLFSAFSTAAKDSGSNLIHES